MNQTNNPPENNVPEIISTIMPQKKKLKNVAALFISIYVPLILSCVAAFIYFSVSIVPNGGLGNLGVAVVGMFIAATGVVISVILSIIFSLRFINNNFKKGLRINWQFTLKFLVCLTIFILIAGTLSRLVSILFTGIISQYAVFVIFPIAIIGFALTTTRMILSEDVGKKTALVTCAFAALFLFFFYGLTYLVQLVSISGASISLNSITSNDMLGNYVYVLIYITIIYSIIYFVFVLPILLIVIGKVNARYENEATGSAVKTIGGMKLRFMIIIFGIAMTAFLILGFLPSDGSMVNSETASDGTQTIVTLVALPSSQSSQRDTQRKNDVILFSTAVITSISNNRGNLPSDSSFTDGSFVAEFLTGSWEDPSSLKTYSIGLSGEPSTDKMVFTRGVNCPNDGSKAGDRQYNIQVKLEGGGVYCSGS